MLEPAVRLECIDKCRVIDYVKAFDEFRCVDIINQDIVVNADNIIFGVMLYNFSL